ncbi:hypothetical protein CORC01_00661 [Colletotrichum orchidophilum]|uniref:BTB domain-containing protein n=1 Tax=Colletotrichum orchidophilum TaxID=1209926 RepID=A0A1G4BQT6_9PEZI|nr:uncharacterized protein CORC01_00661 [Colletotrichum orchidophilum]OHF03799.1 hypothetical protein CORC01_00661 [Colletotrichum orchidophilum]
MDTNGWTPASPQDDSSNQVREASFDNTRDVGPEVSPYASPTCNVYFQSGQPFRVPSNLLCQELENIRHRSHGEIRLKHIPDEAGHVLIHFLHTGSWQTLRVKESLDATKDTSHLNISLHVYAASQAYKLPLLAELGKENISLSAEALPALEVLLLASDACNSLGEDDPWFSAFIKRRTRQLFEDSSSINQSGLLGCFDNATIFSKLLVKSLIEICCDYSVSVNPSESQSSPRLGPSTTSKPVPAPWTDAAEPEVDLTGELALESALGNSLASTSKKDKKKKKKGRKLDETTTESEILALRDAAEPVTNGRY